MIKSKMKTAIIHYWLVNDSGGEKVLGKLVEQTADFRFLERWTSEGWKQAGSGFYNRFVSGIERNFGGGVLTTYLHLSAGDAMSCRYCIVFVINGRKYLSASHC